MRGMAAAATLAALVVAVGCGEEEPTSDRAGESARKAEASGERTGAEEAAEGSDAGEPAGGADAEGQATDAEASDEEVSEAERTVERFLEAAQLGDRARLQELLTEEGDGRMQSLRQGEASDRKLESLAELTEGAEIDGVEERDDGTALVQVKLGESQVLSFELVETEDGWRIESL